MTIGHYEPWRLFNRFHRDIDRVFNDDASSSEAANSSDITWLPVVDVHEEAERFVVRADLPGVDPKDVEITAEKGVLTIRGQRHATTRVATNALSASPELFCAASHCLRAPKQPPSRQSSQTGF
jgi:HSP20 family protein